MPRSKSAPAHGYWTRTLALRRTASGAHADSFRGRAPGAPLCNQTPPRRGARSASVRWGTPEQTRVGEAGWGGLEASELTHQERTLSQSWSGRHLGRGSSLGRPTRRKTARDVTSQDVTSQDVTSQDVNEAVVSLGERLSSSTLSMDICRAGAPSPGAVYPKRPRDDTSFHKKEGGSAVCSNMDAPEGQSAEWREPEEKDKYCGSHFCVQSRDRVITFRGSSTAP
uniref:Uncharacterized protein n=1 Tax=Rangifer tarandus platyrhynchus TaxID=3082113 RepID=A0ACB0FHQ7_RANTA|nr:unnamed protein product [Rangifer tarandus platyrhynchus]